MGEPKRRGWMAATKGVGPLGPHNRKSFLVREPPRYDIWNRPNRLRQIYCDLIAIERVGQRVVIIVPSMPEYSSR
ncbi:hypothetical protein VTI28DRAFT_7212 [Corynascus sepedonium]